MNCDGKKKEKQNRQIERYGHVIWYLMRNNYACIGPLDCLYTLWKSIWIRMYTVHTVRAVKENNNKKIKMAAMWKYFVWNKLLFLLLSWRSVCLLCSEYFHNIFSGYGTLISESSGKNAKKKKIQFTLLITYRLLIIIDGIVVLNGCNF